MILYSSLTNSILTPQSSTTAKSQLLSARNRIVYTSNVAPSLNFRRINSTGSLMPLITGLPIATWRSSVKELFPPHFRSPLIAKYTFFGLVSQQRCSCHLHLWLSRYTLEVIPLKFFSIGYDLLRSLKTAPLSLVFSPVIPEI